MLRFDDVLTRLKRLYPEPKLVTPYNVSTYSYILMYARDPRLLTTHRKIRLKLGEMNHERRFRTIGLWPTATRATCRG